MGAGGSCSKAEEKAAVKAGLGRIYSKCARDASNSVKSHGNEVAELTLTQEVTNFLENVRGFIVARDVLEADAQELLPRRFMDEFPSFSNKSRLRQMLPQEKSTPSTVREILSSAADAKAEFQVTMESIIRKAGFNPEEEVYCSGQLLILDRKNNIPFQRLTIAPLKSVSRCQEKVENEYDGDASRLLDVVRCSLVVDTEEQLEVVARLLSKPESGASYEIVRLKNRFKHPLFNGYRDALYNICVYLSEDFWHVCEVQLHLAAILLHKERSHRYYEFFRSYFAGNMAAVDVRMKLLESFCKDDAPLDQIFRAVVSGTNEEQLSALAVLLGRGMMGQYKLLVPVARRRITLASCRLPEKSPEVLELRKLLADALADIGEFKESRCILAELLSLQKSILGSDSLATARVLTSMAKLDQKQGFYSDGLEKHSKALVIYERVLGNEHKDVAISLNSMAITLMVQGCHQESLELYLRALSIRERLLGLEHPDVAATLHGMAEVHTAQGKYEEAMACYSKSLAMRERTLGEHHPSVAGSLHNMASVREKQGHIEEAIDLQQKAVQIREDILGIEHFLTIKSKKSLTHYLEMQNKSQEASSCPLMDDEWIGQPEAISRWNSAGGRRFSSDVEWTNAVEKQHRLQS